MVLVRDLRFYCKRLVTHDIATMGFFFVSIAALLASTYEAQIGHRNIGIAPELSLFAVVVVLMFSGFRLWRDERRIDEREEVLLREIATILRDQINTQTDQPYRNFTFAENVDDKKYHEKMFRKHLPKICELMDEWIHNPDARANARQMLIAKMIASIPDAVPETMRIPFANSIVNDVGDALLQSLAPEGRFGFTTESYGNSFIGQKLLTHTESHNSMSINPPMPDDVDVDQLVISLNSLTIEAWNSPEAQLWKELIRIDWRKRDELRERLTDTIKKSHMMTRKHCDRECYESPSGD